MKPNDLFLRCYAEKHDDQWEAFCLDLTLAAQGSTFEEARQALHEQISEYIHDALVGEDREYAGYFLRRKAPLQYWLKYYTIKAFCRVRKIKNQTQDLLSGTCSFNEYLPLRPSANA